MKKFIVHYNEIALKGNNRGYFESALVKNLKDKITAVLKEKFRPEFLNRIDEIIIFNYLSKNEIKKIVELELQKVKNRLKNRKIEVKISENTKSFLAQKGFDPNLGARPLKRVIQQLILDPLALKIVSGDLKEKERVSVDTLENKIIFKNLSRVSKIKIGRQYQKEKVSVR